MKILSALALYMNPGPCHTDKSITPWLARWSLHIVRGHRYNQTGLSYTAKYNRSPLPSTTSIVSTQVSSLVNEHVCTEPSQMKTADMFTLADKQIRLSVSQCIAQVLHSITQT